MLLITLFTISFYSFYNFKNQFNVGLWHRTNRMDRFLLDLRSLGVLISFYVLTRLFSPEGKKSDRG